MSKKNSPNRKQKVRAIFSPEAKEFFRGLSDKAKKKFDTNIQKTLAGFTADWFKKLAGTDGLMNFPLTQTIIFIASSLSGISVGKKLH